MIINEKLLNWETLFWDYLHVICNTKHIQCSCIAFSVTLKGSVTSRLLHLATEAVTNFVQHCMSD